MAAGGGHRRICLVSDSEGNAFKRFYLGMKHKQHQRSIYVSADTLKGSCVSGLCAELKGELVCLAFFAPFPACCTVLTELSLDDTSAHHIVQVKEKTPISHIGEYEGVKMEILSRFSPTPTVYPHVCILFLFVGKWGLHHRKVNLTKQLWTNGHIFAGT